MVGCFPEQSSALYAVISLFSYSLLARIVGVVLISSDAAFYSIVVFSSITRRLYGDHQIATRFADRDVFRSLIGVVAFHDVGVINVSDICAYVDITEFDFATAGPAVFCNSFNVIKIGGRRCGSPC